MSASGHHEFRLFLSSTFRDLQEERDYLIKKVFPEIASLCRQRGVTFTEIDLRWGLTEEDQALGRIVRTCLEEIDRCRPWFLGIIGDRYGWVPEYHEIAMDPQLVGTYPWIESAAMDGASILEIELMHGVLNDRSEQPLIYRLRSNDAGPDDAEKMEDLFRRISDRTTVRSFESAADLGEKVRADLQALVDSTWPATTAPDEHEIERRDQAAFAQVRRRAYIPNVEYLKQFNEWVVADGHPLVVSGPVGLGKSALVAWLADQHRRRHADDLVIEHYTGSTPSSVDAIGFMTVVVAAIRDRLDLAEPIPDSEAIAEAFPDWLARYGATEETAGSRLVILFDGVDQLRTGRELDWLPENFPEQVRLLMSVRDGEMADRLAERKWVDLRLRELTVREREAIVTRYLAEYSKGLRGEDLRRISASPAAVSPLYLRTLAEELRVHGEHETLGSTLDDYLAAGSLEALLGLVLDRLEADYGREIVSRFCSALAISRAGLSERELVDALEISRSDLSLLLHAIDVHLIRSGGRLSFFHDFLRAAAETRYCADGGEASLHRALSDYFLAAFRDDIGRDDYNERNLREGLFHCSQAGDLDRLQEMLLDPDVMRTMGNGDTAWELITYWWRILEDAPVADLYRDAVESESWERLSQVELAEGLGAITELLSHRGEWDAAIETARRSIENLGSDSEDMVGLLPILARLGRLLSLRGLHQEAYEVAVRREELAEAAGNKTAVADAIGDRAAIDREQGRLDEAAQGFERMLSLTRERRIKSGTAKALVGLGQVRDLTGDSGGALGLYEEALTIFRAAGDRRQIATLNGLIGLVHWRLGDYETAMEHYETELATAESLCDPLARATSTGMIGLVQMDRGDFDAAEKRFMEYLQGSEQLGYAKGIGFAQGDLGLIRSRTGQTEEARTWFERALETHRDIGFLQGVEMWERELAQLDGTGDDISPGSPR